jgi:hypothetical protein
LSRKVRAAKHGVRQGSAQAGASTAGQRQVLVFIGDQAREPRPAAAQVAQSGHTVREIKVSLP